MSSQAFVARLAVLALLMSTVGAAAQTGSAGAPSPPPSAVSSSQSSTTNSASAPAPEGFFPEPGLLSTAVDFVMDKAGDGTTRKSGFYPEFSNMITGAGWVSLGPGYRQYLRDDHVMLDTSAALSWRLYKMGQARVEFLDLAHDRLTLGIQGMWQDQTQVNFFGIGPDVTEDDQTQYRMQGFDLVGYGTYRATDWLAFDGTLGW